VVWKYAATHAFTIVTKDADSNQLAFLFGPPPKVVWIQRGNCSTSSIEALLRERGRDVLDLEADEDASLLVLK
jgi:predicted nuclease of predicted toxin-antitoxin system